MKKLCLIIVMLLVFVSFVNAQSVSTAELKSVLIDFIKDYLSSQTPKLEKAELKDLIVVYLSTKGDAADLSGNGIFSGKKLFDIYNKAKGVMPVQIPTDAFELKSLSGSIDGLNHFSFMSGKEPLPASYTTLSCNYRSNYFVLRNVPEGVKTLFAHIGPCWHFATKQTLYCSSNQFKVELIHVPTGKVMPCVMYLKSEYHNTTICTDPRFSYACVDSIPSGDYIINISSTGAYCDPEIPNIGADLGIAGRYSNSIYAFSYSAEYPP